MLLYVPIEVRLNENYFHHDYLFGFLSIPSTSRIEREELGKYGGG